MNNQFCLGVNVLNLRHIIGVFPLILAVIRKTDETIQIKRV